MHLLRILWLAAAVFHGAALAAFDVHLSNYEERGFSVFNSSLGDGWSYALHPTLTGEDAKESIEVDRNTGELVLSKFMECESLQENPFLVYVQTHGRTTGTGSEKMGSYVMIPIAVSVHGIGCYPRKAEKNNLNGGDLEHKQDKPLSATRPLQIMMEYPEGTCWFPGDVLFDLLNFLPKSLAGCPISYIISKGQEHHFDIDAASGKLWTENDVVCVFEHQSEHISGSLQIPSTCLAKPQSYFLYSVEEETVPLLIELRVLDSNRLNADFSEDASRNGEVVHKRFRRQMRNSYPSFSQHIYTFQIPENEDSGYVVATITATDNDDGDDGRLSYSLVALGDACSQYMFSIEENTGTVTTTMSLDRELIQSHSFRLTATDHGTPPKSAQVYLTVNVEDRNDNTPLFASRNGEVVHKRFRGQMRNSYPSFSQHIYTFQIPENEDSGYVVATITATDNDDGDDGRLSYSLVALGDACSQYMFSIEENTGTVTTTTSLDRELIQSHSFHLTATDHGTPPKSAQVYLTVNVEDRNDNTPLFEQSSYVETSNEGQNPGTVIARVRASDNDIGLNAEITYSILNKESPNDVFTMNSKNGKIKALVRLDREQTERYYIRVMAQDKGTIPGRRNSTAEVLLTVLDLNDNSPHFSQLSYEVSVREDISPGDPESQILHVIAADADEGSNADVHFSLTHGNFENHFRINSLSGLISLQNSLDFETTRSYRLSIRAQDSGNPPRENTTTVTVTVVDVNDNKPQFTRKVYRASVTENAYYGYEVLTVVATDLDEQNTISYRIADALNPTGHIPFNILTQNNEGTITVTSQLSYNTKSFYSLTVTSSDRQYESTCTVYINVTDVNDFAPVFQNSSYNVYVSEGAEIGEVIVTVSASDNDAGANAEVSYSVDPSDEFEIDEESGEIRTKVLLDREEISSYTLYVTASDHGINPQRSRAFVQITVQDINDNAPVFEDTSYSAEIQENSLPFSSIITILASDADQGSNGDVKYTFEDGDSAGGRFFIDETSGVIRVASMLDREYQAEYDLVAFAYDQGVPSLKASAEITVQITDINDNPPMFDERDYYVTIRENRNPGEQVMKLVASDPDSGLNAHVRYTIVGGDQDYFEINPVTGLITSLEMFDYEAQNQYEITVYATNVPYFAEATVHVQVLDVNDNAPILGNFEIYFNNYEGYFHEGDIGQVPARDPDVSDVLTYEIISGNNNQHLILNTTTGGIRLNPTLRGSDIPQTVQFTVEVSDRINMVMATGKVHMNMVTQDMLVSSVTVQVEDMQPLDFLSQKLLQFIDVIAEIIPTNQNLVYLFSIKGEESMILNITFAAQHTNGSFFSSQYLQQRVYLKRSQLSEALGATVLPLGDNLCLFEICSDFYQCVAPLGFWVPGGFMATASVIFRSIHPEIRYRCNCPPGFTGNYCMVEINFCYSNPCLNRGVCVQKEAGYTCLCREGFIGTNCETDMGNGLCTGGTDSVCKHGGSCHNFLNGGFDCSCPNPDVFDGPFCEIRTRNFPPKSFMMFWSLSQRVRLHLSVSFASLERDGLIFYNGRYNQQHDFIALEIVNSQVQFSFSTGSTVTMVTASRQGGVSDGEWHTVEIDYNLGTARIILDDCDPAIALDNGHQFDDFTCAAETQFLGEHRFLDLNGPFIIGGLPELPSEFPVENTDFDGCLRDIYINHELLDLATNVKDYNTAPGCPHKANFCMSDPCHTGGTCENGWDRYHCHCSEGSGGVNCQEALSTPVRFIGESYMRFNLQHAVTIPWTNRVVFRTSHADGILMFIQLSDSMNTSIELVEGHLHYVTSSVDVQLDQATFNDREWHDITVEWKNDKIKLSMDFDKYKTSVRATDNINGRTVERVDLGGLLTDNGMYKAFTGCMQGMSIGGRLLDPSTVEGINIEEGCNVPNACDTAVCPDHSDCVDIWDAYECQCHKGYVGPNCLSACDLGVCEHGSSCTLDSSAEFGYTCTCSDLYYGDHCENFITECPDGWWGNQICGPCECDEEIGSESACNKTTGECYCSEHSYRPSDSDTCYPCDCYELGSVGQDCDQETGACTCKRGAIGRRCDACVDPHAEVTLRGCLVLFDSCPKHFADGLWWPRTRFSMTATVDCPGASYGYATRYCDYDHYWQTPNLFNCTSDNFFQLQNILENLQNGMKLYPEVSFDIAMKLQEATKETDRFHGNDVSIAYQVLGYLLKHESKQVGLNVTATIMKSFTKKIVETVSRLFEPQNKIYWEMIQQTARGTAEIMEDMEKFALNIARFTNSFSYTPEFSIVTPNIIMHYDIILRDTFTIRTVPEYDEETLLSIDDSSQVHIPGDLIEPHPEIDDLNQISITSNVAVTVFILYSTLQNLLPKSTVSSVRKPDDQVGQVIASPVVSFSIYDELANGTLPDPLQTPVIIEFHSIDAVNRSGPQCVSWDFEFNDGTGGWSTDGCEVAGYSSTHTNCSCSHLTNIAVIMDNAP